MLEIGSPAGRSERPGQNREHKVRKDIRRDTELFCMDFSKYTAVTAAASNTCKPPPTTSLRPRRQISPIKYPTDNVSNHPHGSISPTVLSFKLSLMYSPKKFERNNEPVVYSICET